MTTPREPENFIDESGSLSLEPDHTGETLSKGMPPQAEGVLHEDVLINAEIAWNEEAGDYAIQQAALGSLTEHLRDLDFPAKPEEILHHLSRTGSLGHHDIRSLPLEEMLKARGRDSFRDHYDLIAFLESQLKLIFPTVG